MLNVIGLNISYGRISVLRNINFSLNPGSFTALLGANGTGKSSLLKGIAGLISATGTVGHREAENLTPRQRTNTIAYMPQDTGSISSLTVTEVILLGRLNSLGMQVPQTLVSEARQALARFGLQELETRTLGEISGGQRQLVYLAQTLFRNPKVLLLDEPTAALDLRHQLIVLDRVLSHCRKNGTIAIAAMHDLSLAAKCADRVLCLSQGVIVANGVPDQVLQAPLIRGMYGVDVEILTSTNGTIHITPLRAVDVDHSKSAL